VQKQLVPGLGTCHSKCTGAKVCDRGDNEVATSGGSESLSATDGCDRSTEVGDTAVPVHAAPCVSFSCLSVCLWVCLSIWVCSSVEPSEVDQKTPFFHTCFCIWKIYENAENVCPIQLQLDLSNLGNTNSKIICYSNVITFISNSYTNKHWANPDSKCCSVLSF